MSRSNITWYDRDGEPHGLGTHVSWEQWRRALHAHPLAWPRREHFLDICFKGIVACGRAILSPDSGVRTLGEVTATSKRRYTLSPAERDRIRRDRFYARLGEYRMQYRRGYLTPGDILDRWRKSSQPEAEFAFVETFPWLKNNHVFQREVEAFERRQGRRPNRSGRDRHGWFYRTDGALIYDSEED